MSIQPGIWLARLSKGGGSDKYASAYLTDQRITMQLMLHIIYADVIFYHYDKNLHRRMDVSFDFNPPRKGWCDVLEKGW